MWIVVFSRNGKLCSAHNSRAGEDFLIRVSGGSYIGSNSSSIHILQTDATLVTIGGSYIALLSVRSIDTILVVAVI